MKNIAPKLILASVLVSSSSAVMAADNQWKDKSYDAWLDGKAETALLLNTNLNSFDINTDVDNKVVTLTGQVSNSTEKDLAGELVAGLEGVESVNNELTVQGGEQSSENQALGALQDTKITTLVKTKLLMNRDVSGTDIEVETNDGTVVLNGSVDSDAEHDLAINIARNTDQVNDVVDNLEVTQ